MAVVTVAARASPLPLSYTARTRGEREVEVRARVSGIILRRFYREGAKVAAGDKLFTIDSAGFAADVRSARGRLGVEEARLHAATRQWRRTKQLADRGFTSGRSHDDAEADYLAAKAGVAAARAELARAQLNLSYTDVRAPIGGITGREARSEGSLVDTEDDSALLTTITQSDRLYIDFAMPEAEARLLRAAMAADPEAVRVQVNPVAGAAPPMVARIDFVSAQVTPGTSTVNISATFDNRAARLAPGQFVRAEIAGLTTAAGIYVPARAVLYGADGAFVWKVDRKNRAQIQPVRLGPGNGNLLRVESGLMPRDRVIVDGVMKLQPDMAVKPVEVAVDARPAQGAGGQ